jgi:hypothetical protein
MTVGEARMTRKLLRGEIPITSWMGVTLTTHRVWQVIRQGQATSMVSIPLDAVQWIKLGRNHLPFLLWMALLVALLGIVALEHDRTVTYWLFGVVLLLLLLYGTSRRLIVSIGAGSGEILVQVAGETASVEAALDFIQQVELQRFTSAPQAPERPPTGSASSSSSWVSPPDPTLGL